MRAFEFFVAGGALSVYACRLICRRLIIYSFSKREGRYKELAWRIAFAIIR